MPRTIYVSMIPYNWRKTFDTFDVKILELLKKCTEGTPTVDDTRPLHIVLASEYMFRRNPMSIVKKPKESKFLSDKSDVSKFPPPKSPTADRRSYAHSIHSAAEKDQLIIRLCVATGGKNIMIVAGSIVWAEKEPVMAGSKVVTKGEVLNSSYIIYNGSVACHYDKSLDVAELDIYERDLFNFKPGDKQGGIFVADGLSFGIEICGDHGGIRHPSSTSTDTVQTLDIHMLVSDGASFASPALRTGGYGLHCDRSACTVWQADTSYAGRKRITAGGNLTWTLALD